MSLYLEAEDQGIPLLKADTCPNGEAVLGTKELICKCYQRKDKLGTWRGG